MSVKDIDSLLYQQLAQAQNGARVELARYRNVKSGEAFSTDYMIEGVRAGLGANRYDNRIELSRIQMFNKCEGPPLGAVYAKSGVQMRYTAAAIPGLGFGR